MPDEITAPWPELRMSKCLPLEMKEIRQREEKAQTVDENKSITGQASNVKLSTPEQFGIPPRKLVLTIIHIQASHLFVHRIPPPSSPQTLRTLVQKPRSQTLDLCFWKLIIRLFF